MQSIRQGINPLPLTGLEVPVATVAHELAPLNMALILRYIPFYIQVGAAHLPCCLQSHGSHLQELTLDSNDHLTALLKQQGCFASLQKLVCMRMRLKGEPEVDCEGERAWVPNVQHYR